MKAYELRLWQVFYNNNGHLSMVYNIKGNDLYIINYNGSIYTVNWRNEDSRTEYKESSMTAYIFLQNYPRNKVSFERKEALKTIERHFMINMTNYELMTKSCNKENKINKKLLLLTR